MDGSTLAPVIGAVQGIRETVEKYRDELGESDLALACYALEGVESDLFDVWDDLDGGELDRMAALVNAFQMHV